MSLLTTSLSGLMAATSRYTASANNIANAQSTKSSNGSGPYVPEEVTSQETDSGVSIRIQARNPASRQTNDPGNGSANENGLAQTPDIDQSGELINQTAATYDFQANLTVLRTEQKVQQNLLDIYV